MNFIRDERKKCEAEFAEGQAYTPDDEFYKKCYKAKYEEALKRALPKEKDESLYIKYPMYALAWNEYSKELKENLKREGVEI